MVKTNGEGKIIEMCHGFDAEAIYQCGGYWDSSLNWHDEPLNVKTELLSTIAEQAGLLPNKSGGGLNTSLS